jgi:acylpyruvate hydrolase
MKIICIGRNYAEHAKELNNPLPAKPVFFMKPETALIRDNQPFYLPEFSNDVHHEVEVVFRICRPGKNIQEQFANRYYDQISMGIDFTARDLQQDCKTKGLPWEVAKAFDGSAPLGKLKSIKEFNNLQNLNFSLKINGETRQEGNTSAMIFSIDKIIAYLSQYITLKTGDLIYTGTPEGVAAVKTGDKLEAFLEGEKMLEFEVK